MHDPFTMITLILGVMALSVGLVLARGTRRRADSHRKEFFDAEHKRQELAEQLIQTLEETNALLRKLTEQKGT